MFGNVYITNFHKYLFHADMSKRSKQTWREEKAVFNIITDECFLVKSHSGGKFNFGTIKLHEHACDLPEEICLLPLKSGLALVGSKSNV